MIKILVIDQDTDLRNEVVNWLGVEGFEALSAEDGNAGVKYAYSHIPHLIICDLTVPGLDGYGVLLELRANPLTAETPVIFLTSGEAQPDLRPRIILGADDYIAKPFTQNEFLKTVKSRLEKKSKQESDLQIQVAQLEQALAQEHEQRLLKSKFTAMVVHDFRNHLTSILSSNGLLRSYADRMDESRRLMHMTRIDASVQQLLAMLDEMLILAQIESGSLALRLEPLKIGLFLQTIVDDFQAIYSDTHHIIYECHFTFAVMADSRLLQQIATNLISNAIKYSPPTSTVRVMLDRDDAHIILSVQDHGIGISDADQLNLASAFHRGANVGSTPGTGLGLTIVKQAVELHGGTVQVESHLDSGTLMVIRLPIQPAVNGIENGALQPDSLATNDVR